MREGWGRIGWILRYVNKFVDVQTSNMYLCPTLCMAPFYLVFAIHAINRVIWPLIDSHETCCSEKPAIQHPSS